MHPPRGPQGPYTPKINLFNILTLLYVFPIDPFKGLEAMVGVARSKLVFYVCSVCFICVTRAFDFGPDVNIVPRTWAVLCTMSSLTEQTTPFAWTPTDLNASVSTITFPDHDLDFDDIGGTVPCPVQV